MRFGIFLTIVFAIGRISFAQQAIQQPVVGVSSVDTTVSVPDRGRMFFGGVSSAQSGRSQYGPLRSGPSIGLSRQASSISTSVYIHDLHAMDEEILNSAPTMSSARRPIAGIVTTKPTRDSVVETVISPTEKAANHEQLARKAEEAGKSGVAKLHWQMAAKYGSKSAAARLTELSQTSPSQSKRTAARHDPPQ